MLNIKHFELTTLDKRLFAIIDHLRKHRKRANLDNIYNKLTKMADFKNVSKERLSDRIIELNFQRKIINKPNKNDDSYYVNKSIADFNIDQYTNLQTGDLSFAAPNTKQPSSIDLVNTPSNPISIIPETPNLPQKDINGKESVRTIIESETLIDNIFKNMKIENLKTEMISSFESTISLLCQKELNILKDTCEKIMQKSYSYYSEQIDNFRAEIEKKYKINMCEMKIQNLKTEIISSLQSNISLLCQEKLNTLKDNCEKSMQKSYSYYNEQIDNLRMEIESKGEIIDKLSATPNKITNYFSLKDPTVALKNNDLVPETVPSNYNENILSYAVDRSMQQLVKDKEDCANIPGSSIKIIEQIADYRQQKSQQYVLTKKSAKSGVSDENRIMNLNEVKYRWPAGNCVIVEDAIITGMDEKEWILVRQP